MTLQARPEFLATTFPVKSLSVIIYIIIFKEYTKIIYLYMNIITLLSNMPVVFHRTNEIRRGTCNDCEYILFNNSHVKPH